MVGVKTDEQIAESRKKMNDLIERNRQKIEKLKQANTVSVKPLYKGPTADVDTVSRLNTLRQRAANIVNVQVNVAVMQNVPAGSENVKPEVEGEYPLYREVLEPADQVDNRTESEAEDDLLRRLVVDGHVSDAADLVQTYPDILLRQSAELLEGVKNKDKFIDAFRKALGKDIAPNEDLWAGISRINEEKRKTKLEDLDNIKVPTPEEFAISDSVLAENFGSKEEVAKLSEAIKNKDKEALAAAMEKNPNIIFLLPYKDIAKDETLRQTAETALLKNYPDLYNLTPGCKSPVYAERNELGFVGCVSRLAAESFSNCATSDGLNKEFYNSYTHDFLKSRGNIDPNRSFQSGMDRQVKIDELKKRHDYKDEVTPPITVEYRMLNGTLISSKFHQRG